MGNSTNIETKGTRCIALVGPYSSGKTSLLEALLFRAGAIDRLGSVDDGTSVGDAAPEARSHHMSVELNVARAEFMGEDYQFIDCPGSVEFSQEQIAALAVCDAAIVVCEADESKVPTLQMTLQRLDALGVPRFIFVNKIDKAEMHLRDVLDLLQPASKTPLLLRQVPIWKDGVATGFVDLALERAYVYQEGGSSEVIDMPEDVAEREKTARFNMLETLADFDDELLEQLLMDIEPPRDRIFDDLSQDLAAGVITPVMFGSALNGNGIFRLLKALRHEVRDVAGLNRQLKDEAAAGFNGFQVIKTLYTAHGGKLSVGRVFGADISDGQVLKDKEGKDQRVSGLFELVGAETSKIAKAGHGDIAALGRMETVRTGDVLAPEMVPADAMNALEVLPGVFAQAIEVEDRKDEVKLTGGAEKLTEEDPSLCLEHNMETNELVLWGQGEMHLRVALARMAGKFSIKVQSRPRRIAYKETISRPGKARYRYKKQSGGHGQYGDVELVVKPLPRGSGFVFTDSISGGVVPKQYIPAVEHGVREYLNSGPLGFPVVDIAVNLADGSHHNVDSSEQAFKQAAILAMKEVMAGCRPVLLEPIVAVEIQCPGNATARINQIVSGHRGQILGFDNRSGWSGWETVQALMPEAETTGLIIELRSASTGAASFTFSPDHLAEFSGREADKIVAAARQAAA